MKLWSKTLILQR